MGAKNRSLISNLYPAQADPIGTVPQNSIGVKLGSGGMTD